MNTKRPRIKVPFETVDVIIEMLSITLLILMWTYCIINYFELPDTIATHFDATGNPMILEVKILFGLFQW